MGKTDSHSEKRSGSLLLALELTDLPEGYQCLLGCRKRSVRRAAFLAACVAILACATTPKLVPEGMMSPIPGHPLAAKGHTVQGITVSGVAELWTYSPRNLPEHVIPLRVKIVNHRAEPILVSLSDVALVDERGHRRGVISPADAVQRAARGEGNGYSGGPGVRPGISISKGIGIGGIGIQLGGIGVGGSGGPFGSAGGGDGSNEIGTLHVGLRSGRLDPGKSVEGYLFFETPLSSADRDRGFHIAWNFRPLTPIGSPLAPPIAMVEVPLVAR